MDQVPLFDAITILVGVSVFSTGFLSVRIHANKDRLLERINMLNERLQYPSESKDSTHIYDYRRIIEEIEGYKTVAEMDFIALATGLGNFGVFFLVAVLTTLMISRNWKFTLSLSSTLPEFWALMAILLVEFGIAILGWKDLKQVYDEIKDHLNRSLAMRLHGAQTKAEEDGFEHALSIYDKIVKDFPYVFLSTFFRGLAYLENGNSAEMDKSNNKAAEYFKQAHDDFIRSSNLLTTSTIFVYASEASLRAKKHDIALKEAIRAINLDPSNALSYLIRAMVYNAQGDYSRAKEDFETALQLDPTLDA